MDTEASRARTVFTILYQKYEDPRTLLDYASPFELLISVILSAQTTDRQVNEVTPDLFAAYPDADSLSRADLNKVEDIIRSTGFYRQKAKNIIATARRLVERHQGIVPSGMDELTSLPGVGRKSANVVLGHIFNRPAVIVDTHFSRVVRRLGLTRAEQPERIEKEIALLLDPEFHTRFSMVINYHGRDLCLARRPKCAECPLNTVCPFYPDRE